MYPVPLKYALMNAA